ncbi:MAG: hypothetical protein CFE44_19245 [Burkholderiales bacterium PBB4]|nr:MAG: hypothetical protein CFE44_19245 [Burkholderiales bacterium PBB4]
MTAGARKLRVIPPLDTGRPVELMPGDVVFGQSGDPFKTLLGSCICVILTDPRRTVAALCHIVHVGTPNAANQNNSAYGEVAMRQMFEHLQQRGLSPARCEAYVFGGGNMFPQHFGGTHVGQTNAAWVFDYLDACHIAIRAHDVGGNGYRKIAWTVGPDAPLVDTVFPEEGSHHGS